MEKINNSDDNNDNYDINDNDNDNNNDYIQSLESWDYSDVNINKFDEDYVRPPIDIIRERLIPDDNAFLYNGEPYNHDMNNDDMNNDDINNYGMNNDDINNYGMNVHNMNYDKLYIDELNSAIEESKLMHEKQIEIEKNIKYKMELFQKLDIQLGYILLQKDEEIIFFNNCFKEARDDYINNNKEYIFLYKGHYDYLNNFLDDIYTKPKNKNRKTKIDDELYNLLINCMKYY